MTHIFQCNWNLARTSGRRLQPLLCTFFSLSYYPKEASRDFFSFLCGNMKKNPAKILFFYTISITTPVIIIIPVVLPPFVPDTIFVPDTTSKHFILSCSWGSLVCDRRITSYSKKKKELTWIMKLKSPEADLSVSMALSACSNERNRFVPFSTSQVSFLLCYFQYQGRLNLLLANTVAKMTPRQFMCILPYSSL